MSLLCSAKVSERAHRNELVYSMNAHRGFLVTKGRRLKRQGFLAWGSWILHTWKSPLEGGVVCKCSAGGLSPNDEHQLVRVTLPRGDFATASPLALRGGTVLLCWKDSAAWEPSRHTHESKVLWSLSSSSKEAENSLSLVSCNTGLRRSQSLTVKQWKMKSKKSVSWMT